MTEIPERMEREMFELRSKMAPDVRDLKQHVSPQAVGNKAKRRVTASIVNFGKGLLGSAKYQADKAREAGEKRDTSALTNAVKSDPRPMIILAVVLAIVMFFILGAGRKATGDD
ncbi:hypothetical protein BH24ACT21_BH24ACT21_08170 [soil metagenome]|jgi:hypothetical protein